MKNFYFIINNKLNYLNCVKSVVLLLLLFNLKTNLKKNK